MSQGLAHYVKKKIFGTTAVIIVLLAVFVLAQCFYTVSPDKYANTVRFSKTVNTVSQPGLYFKLPFVDNVIYFPKQVLLYDMKPSDVLTADSKTMQVDNYVTWRITDPLTFYKTLGNITEAETRINMLTYSAIKTEMGKLERDKIINSDESSRDNFNNNIINGCILAALESYRGYACILIKHLNYILQTNKPFIPIRIANTRCRHI